MQLTTKLLDTHCSQNVTVYFCFHFHGVLQWCWLQYVGQTVTFLLRQLMTIWLSQLKLLSGCTPSFLCWMWHNWGVLLILPVWTGVASQSVSGATKWAHLINAQKTQQRNTFWVYHMPPYLYDTSPSHVHHLCMHSRVLLPSISANLQHFCEWLQLHMPCICSMNNLSSLLCCGAWFQNNGHSGVWGMCYIV